jgi:hypothetical protein
MFQVLEEYKMTQEEFEKKQTEALKEILEDVLPDLEKLAGAMVHTKKIAEVNGIKQGFLDVTLWENYAEYFINQTINEQLGQITRTKEFWYRVAELMIEDQKEFDNNQEA